MKIMITVSPGEREIQDTIRRSLHQVNLSHDMIDTTMTVNT